MYFSQALITLVFVTQVEQSNSENDGFKDKPCDKLAPASRTCKISISKLNLTALPLTIKNWFYFKIILSLASTNT